MKKICKYLKRNLRDVPWRPPEDPDCCISTGSHSNRRLPFDVFCPLAFAAAVCFCLGCQRQIQPLQVDRARAQLELKTQVFLHVHRMLQRNRKFLFFQLTDVWLLLLRDVLEDVFIQVEVEILQVHVQLVLQRLALPQFFDQILADLVQEAANKHTESIRIDTAVVLTQQIENFVQIVVCHLWKVTEELLH